ncbi:UPF0301 protein [Nymphaea thermarum]|nr:UPF0301 protein [Nymphaea thermarum]
MESALCRSQERNFVKVIPKCTESQLRGPEGEDDSEPSIVNSDWRAFRARLVAGEQATKSSAGAPNQWPDLGLTKPSRVVTLGQKWAHPIHEPERGCLLVATQRLDGVHIFERTVILVLSAGAAGATGVILNRPSLMSIKETRSTDLDKNGVFSDRPLFFGGPLEEGLFLMSAQDEGLEREGAAVAFDEVMKGLYYGMKESVGCAADMVRKKVVGLGDFRFFDGCCGWEREQLSEEIGAGYWKVVACSPGAIGLSRVGSVSLWSEILGLMGEKQAW